MTGVSLLQAQEQSSLRGILRRLGLGALYQLWPEKGDFDMIANSCM